MQPCVIVVHDGQPCCRIGQYRKLLVAVLTFLITRKDDHSSSGGYFLAGRSLTFPLIAGSLLLTNLSTEQMVGLNGAAFTGGLSVMVWEVVAVLALVAMALFFLPQFLKSGVATVPQYLEIRFDHQTLSRRPSASKRAGGPVYRRTKNLFSYQTVSRSRASRFFSASPVPD